MIELNRKIDLEAIKRIETGQRMSQAVTYNGVAYLAGQVGQAGASVTDQTRAILATGSLASLSRRIRVPTAIIHGTADPLVRPVAARQLKHLIPHARLELIEGMGHDLPEPLLERFAEISLSVIRGRD